MTVRTKTITLVREDGSREARIHNIATMILNKGEWRGKEVSTRHLREEIRSSLKMEKLAGEALLGDLRATGDAAGGHGLKLETRRYRSRDNVFHTLIKINQDTIDKCLNYHKNYDDEADPNILL